MRMGKPLIWIGNIWILFGWFMFMAISTSIKFESIPPAVANFTNPSLMILMFTITLHMLIYFIPGLIVVALGKILTYYEPPTN